jgi:hypothetical protein
MEKSPTQIRDAKVKALTRAENKVLSLTVFERHVKVFELGFP